MGAELEGGVGGGRWRRRSAVARMRMSLLRGHFSFGGGERMGVKCADLSVLVVSLLFMGRWVETRDGGYGLLDVKLWGFLVGF